MFLKKCYPCISKTGIQAQGQQKKILVDRLTVEQMLSCDTKVKQLE